VIDGDVARPLAGRDPIIRDFETSAIVYDVRIERGATTFKSRAQNQKVPLRSIKLFGRAKTSNCNIISFRNEWFLIKYRKVTKSCSSRSACKKSVFVLSGKTRGNKKNKRECKTFQLRTKKLYGQENLLVVNIYIFIT